MPGARDGASDPSGASGEEDDDDDEEGHGVRGFHATMQHLHLAQMLSQAADRGASWLAASSSDDNDDNEDEDEEEEEEVNGEEEDQEEEGGEGSASGAGAGEAEGDSDDEHDEEGDSDDSGESDEAHERAVGTNGDDTSDHSADDEEMSLSEEATLSVMRRMIAASVAGGSTGVVSVAQTQLPRRRRVLPVARAASGQGHRAASHSPARVTQHASRASPAAVLVGDEERPARRGSSLSHTVV